jgi:putative SOS response-associated peptidase YedK
VRPLYLHKLTWAQIVSLYRLTLPDEPPEQLKENYNVAPTNVMPIIRPSGNGRELIMAGWGLVPYWLKADQLGKQPYSTINARSDRIQTAPTYREPFRKRRCLVPTTGWYEWQRINAKTKRPFHFRLTSEPFAFAGVYDLWGADGGPAITSFAIVTTDAAPSTSAYHDRMPLVLEESQFEDWMRGPTGLAAEMMKPYGGAIEAWEVDAAVGNVRNNRPELTDRVGLL